MDSLKFQIPSNSGISILDARGNKNYVYVAQNNKTLVKPTMVDNLDLEKITKKYKHLTIYKYFKDVNIFNNLTFHLNSFKLVKNINNLTPFYIKPAI
jgi:tRNA A37 threonylcarbamoyladenosine modification protein TsaB